MKQVKTLTNYCPHCGTVLSACVQKHPRWWQVTIRCKGCDRRYIGQRRETRKEILKALRDL